MRCGIALLALALGACSFDALSVGDAGESSGTTRADSSEAGSASTSGTSTGDPVSEGDSTSTGGSASTGSSSESAGDSSTGEVPLMWCGGQSELAACYDFTAVGRGTLLDLTGNGNDAAAVGVGVVPGPFGEAATFNEGSEIAVPDSPSLDIDASLTIEAWIRVDGLAADSRMGVLDNEGQYSLIILPSDVYRCNLGGLDVQVGPVVLSEWTHTACVFDGTNLRAYVNGSEEGMAGGGEPLATTNTEPMSIGDTSPAFDEPLRGAIGGVRVWTRALLPEEVCEAAGEACRG